MKNQMLRLFCSLVLLLVSGGSVRAAEVGFSIQPGIYSKGSCRVEITRESFDGKTAAEGVFLIRATGKASRTVVLELDSLKGELFRVRGKKEKMLASAVEEKGVREFRITGKALKDEIVRLTIDSEGSALIGFYASVEEGRLKLAHGMKVGIAGQSRTIIENCDGLQKVPATTKVDMGVEPLGTPAAE